MLEKVVKVFRNAHVTPCQGSFEFCPRGPLVSHLFSSAWRVVVGFSSYKAEWTPSALGFP